MHRKFLVEISQMVEVGISGCYTEFWISFFYGFLNESEFYIYRDDKDDI